ncbi:MAG TPA: lysozyme inhibitor LprI family protein [Advenella sp.]|nr:lysozyme inhibitor LprI family protein [Advenella sp.]
MFRNVLLCPVLACTVIFASANNRSYAATQSDMNQAASTDYKTADARLNKVYREVFNKLEAAQKSDLKAAQNAWIQFRDLDCKFQSSGAQGGSIQAMLIAGCMTDKTQARADELNTLLQCKEGDVSCVTAP